MQEQIAFGDGFIIHTERPHQKERTETTRQQQRMVTTITKHPNQLENGPFGRPQPSTDRIWYGTPSLDPEIPQSDWGNAAANSPCCRRRTNPKMGEEARQCNHSNSTQDVLRVKNTNWSRYKLLRKKLMQENIPFIVWLYLAGNKVVLVPTWRAWLPGNICTCIPVLSKTSAPGVDPRLRARDILLNSEHNWTLVDERITKI